MTIETCCFQSHLVTLKYIRKLWMGWRKLGQVLMHSSTNLVLAKQKVKQYECVWCTRQLVCGLIDWEPDQQEEQLTSHYNGLTSMRSELPRSAENTPIM